MDLQLFSSLLRNLLHINVLFGDAESDIFAQFQEKYCYHAALQPAFTAETLRRLAGEAQENTIYGLQDDLGICLQFFLFDSRLFLLGPFVRSEFQEEKIQNVLLSHHISVSYAASIRLYYSAFPIVSATQARTAVTALINAFTGKSEEIIYCRLKETTANAALPLPSREEALDYSTLHHRYDLENAFLRRIETGDVENVIPALRRMTLDGLRQNRYVNAIYTDPGMGIAMLRAMARKAAERGGASLVEIHEITQRAVQRMAASSDMRDLTRCSDAMILELTEAVRSSQQSLGAFSAPVRRVLEHIRLNYSQELTLMELAKIAGLSESYLTKAFKKELGMSIFPYIAHLRCKKAAEMLRESAASVQEISSYVGYEDSNYFVKVFKKQYEKTPSAYRAAFK